MNTAVKRQPIPFGKYLLLDRINIGGMAEVWRGKTFGAGGFERLVAIKRILPNIAEDEEFITMFIDEAKITVQLNHANIAQIYELSHLSNSYFIAMEYIPGKDMRAIFDRCRKKGEPAPIPLTCYVVSKCCEGLDYAHRKNVNGRDLNIVHRDVSPQNVLISYEGEVKVIDFGIAKAAGKATKTQAGILKGKFGYMSPEQIRGLPLDRRSDVFAIGVCLYEMLTGERLFVGDSDFSVLEKVRKVEVLPPSTYNRKIPEGLEKIVMKSLAKDVDDRYQYASELADDLQRFLITSESIFSRKDLAQYMKSTFAEEVEREKQRIIEFGEIKAPEGMIAAAEAGYGGNMPMLAAMGAPMNAQSPSAITGYPTNSNTNVPTNIPTNVPSNPGARSPTGTIPVVAPSYPRLQPVAGPGAMAHATNARASAPPMLQPVSAPQAPPPPPSDGGLPALARHTPSGPGIPRLTAAAPMLSNVKEDSATQLVDGETLFNPGAGPVPQENPVDNSTVAMDSPFGGNQPATDPMRQAVSRDSADLTPATPMNAVPDMTLPPSGPPPGVGNLAKVTVVEAARNNAALRTGRRQTAPGPLPSAQLNEAPTDSAGAVPTGTQARRRRPGGAPEPAAARPKGSSGSGTTQFEPVSSSSGRSSGLVIALVVALLVVIGGGVTVLLLSKSKGLVYIEVPEGAEVTEITVNGDILTPPGGAWTAQSFPLLQKVPTGKANVLIKVKGYKPVFDAVTVKDDGEAVHISNKFEKL